MWIPKRANNQKNETHTHSNIMKSNVFGSTTRIVSNNEIGNRLQINNKPCAHFIDKLRLSTSFESLPSFSPIWFRNLKSARKIFLFVSLSLFSSFSLIIYECNHSFIGVFHKDTQKKKILKRSERMRGLDFCCCSGKNNEKDEMIIILRVSLFSHQKLSVSHLLWFVKRHE